MAELADAADSKSYNEASETLVNTGVSGVYYFRQLVDCEELLGVFGK